MSDFGIEGVSHNYGIGPGNETESTNKQTSEHPENQADKINTTNRNTDEKENNLSKSQGVSIQKGSSPDNQVKTETTNKMDDKEQNKENVSVKSIPDVVSEAEKEKNVFELTETSHEPAKQKDHANDSLEANKKNNGDLVSKGGNAKYNLGSEKSAYSILEITSQCAEHDETYIFICDKCDTPVCRTCVVREHKGHKLSDIEETATARENALANVLTPRIAGAVRNSSEMSLNLSTFDSEINDINKAIRQHGEAIKDAVDKQVAMMIKTVNEKSRKRRTKYQELNKVLDNAVEKAKSLQKRHQYLTKSKNDGALILELKRLAQDAHEFDYPAVPSFPSVKYNPPKITEGDIAALFGSFSFM